MKTHRLHQTWARGLLFRFRVGGACVGARLHLCGVVHVVGLRRSIRRLLHGRQRLVVGRSNRRQSALVLCARYPSCGCCRGCAFRSYGGAYWHSRCGRRGCRSLGRSRAFTRTAQYWPPMRRRGAPHHDSPIEGSSRSQVRELPVPLATAVAGAPAAGFKDGSGWLLRAAVNSAASRL